MENGKENKTGYRVEQDSIGAKDIPGDVYYGVQSLRAAENFRITGLNMHPEIIKQSCVHKESICDHQTARVGFWKRKRQKQSYRQCVMKSLQENCMSTLS